MRIHSSCVALVIAVLGAASAWTMPWSRRATTTPLNLYLDAEGGPNGHPGSPRTNPELFQRALLEERFRLEGRLDPREDQEELLHRALLQMRLEIEARQRGGALQQPPISVQQQPSDILHQSLDDARLERETRARNAAVLVEKALPTQERKAAPTSWFARRRALLKARLGFESKARAAKVSSDKVSTNEKKEQKPLDFGHAIAQSNESPRLSPSFETQRALLETRLALESKARRRTNSVRRDAHNAPVPVTNEEEQKAKKPPFWRSPDQVSQSLIRTFTPDKGVKELKEDSQKSDNELVGFAASRVFKGVIKGSKAAFLGLGELFSTPKDPEPVVEAVGESTQSFVSAAAAVAALGWRQGLKAEAYLEKAQAEAKKAREKAILLEQERRKQAAILEAERKEQEAIRLAAEMKAEEERLAAEALAEEQQRIAAEEERLAEEQRIVAEKKMREEQLATEKRMEEERIAAEEKELEDITKTAEWAKVEAAALIKQKIAAKKGTPVEQPTKMEADKVYFGSLEAKKPAQIEAEEHQAEAEKRALAEAEKRAQVEAEIRAQMKAEKQAQIEAKKRAQIEAEKQAQIEIELEPQIDKFGRIVYR